MHQKNQEIGNLQKEIEKLETEVRSLKYNNNSPNLRQALAETQKKCEFEEKKVNQLNSLVKEKEGQIRSLSNSLRMRDQQVAQLNHNLRNQVPSEEVERLRRLLQNKEEELRRSRQKERELAERMEVVEKANRQLKGELEGLKKNREKEADLLMDQKQKTLEKMLQEKEKSSQRVMAMKDQQIRQLQENLNFFKKQAEDFKIEAKNAKDTKEQKIRDFEKELDEQNDQMKLMRRDLIEMEKIIEDKDSALKKMTEIQYQGRLTRR